MVAIAEVGRRGVGRYTGQLQSLPILALSAHSACNCRCVMCDIWKANAEKREIGVDELDRHMASIRRLHVQRVMLTGGEPLLHRNLWALCDRLAAEGIRITLVTTGLLIDQHADAIARAVDELVISIDGASDVHDEIRRVRGGFERIRRGLLKLAGQPAPPRTIARSVVQQANHTTLVRTVHATQELGIDRLSFLAADLSSTAFNRPEPWSESRRLEIAVTRDQLPQLKASIQEIESVCRDALDRGFVVGGMASLWRIYDYYCGIAGVSPFPRVRCNAPWVSAVLEPGGHLRPCFFHPAYPSAGDVPLELTLNSPAARAFRRALDVSSNETCRRCVCSLMLPLWRNP